MSSILEKLEQEDLSDEVERLAYELNEASEDIENLKEEVKTMEQDNEPDFLVLEAKVEEALGLAKYDENKTVLSGNLIKAFKDVGLKLVEIDK